MRWSKNITNFIMYVETGGRIKDVCGSLILFVLYDTKAITKLSPDSGHSGVTGQATFMMNRVGYNTALLRDLVWEVLTRKLKTYNKNKFWKIFKICMVLSHRPVGPHLIHVEVLHFILWVLTMELYKFLGLNVFVLFLGFEKFYIKR